MGSSVHLQRSAPARPLAPAREPIRFQHPEMPPMDAVLAYFRRSEQAGWFSNGGPCSIELTARLEQRLGAGTHAVLVSNATMGLLAALGAACGVPTAARRLIVTPSYTFTATACAIEWAGARTAYVPSVVVAHTRERTSIEADPGVRLPAAPTPAELIADVRATDARWLLDVAPLHACLPTS